jgi:hypothetical protein
MNKNDPHFGAGQGTPTDLPFRLATLTRFQSEQISLAIEQLIAMKEEKHYECKDDEYYSCPKSDNGCGDDMAGPECDCGLDKRHAKIDQVIRILRLPLD